jgi:DNA polymerase III epsilon subunit-like protein
VTWHVRAERVIDTLVLARRKHPGGHNTLDDLCARYGVDRSPPRSTRRAARTTENMR